MTNSGTENSAAPDGPTLNRKLSYYAVVFLDLLGQRAAIASLEDLKLLRDDEAEYYRRFGEAAGKVWGVRTFFSKRLARGMAAALPSAAYHVPDVTFQMFLDTVMVYFPWDPQNPNALIALKSLLVATAETMICTLSSGVPIRGGLDVHLATEFNEQAQVENSSSALFHGGDLWGPAPKRAYELAEKDHNYMRVRLGDGVSGLTITALLWFKEQVGIDPSKVIWFQPAVDAANETTKLIARDPVDNLPIIDYLGPATVDLMPANTLLVGKAVAFARREYERFKADTNSRSIADKYERFLKYADARRVPNGILPPLAGK